MADVHVKGGIGNRRTARRLPLRSGVTLVELVITSTITLILIFAMGVLVDGAHRAWNRTYEYIHDDISQDVVKITTTLGSVGRRANRTNYQIYRITNGLFTAVAGNPSRDREIVSGDAVEFRYWDVPLDASDSHGIMHTEVTATAYALFYVEGGQLKLDYGPYPPGAIPPGGGRRNTAGVTTQVLAENVSPCADIRPFSHTLINGIGQGCIRLKVILTNPEDESTTTVMSAVMMRNIWPR